MMTFKQIDKVLMAVYMRWTGSIDYISWPHNVVVTGSYSDFTYPVSYDLEHLNGPLVINLNGFEGYKKFNFPIVWMKHV